MEQHHDPNPRHIAPSIGRIILEDANGHPVWSVMYDIAPIYRAHQLFCEDGTYVEQRQDGQGVWHYRYDRPRSNAQTVDEHLTDFVAIPVPCCATCGRVL